MYELMHLEVMRVSEARWNVYVDGSDEIRYTVDDGPYGPEIKVRADGGREWTIPADGPTGRRIWAAVLQTRTASSRSS